MQKVEALRKKHPRFIYNKYSYKIIGGNLEMVFDFLLEPDIKFKPKIIIKNINKARLKKIGLPVGTSSRRSRAGARVLNNFVFHLGLMEMPSYWKAACPPDIVIEAGYLTKEQILWWKNLFIKGMGQFFYENKIDWRKPDFLRIRSQSIKNNQYKFKGKVSNRYLVPISGGKDSIVTLEKLKNKNTNAFVLDPKKFKFALPVLRTAKIKNPLMAERKMDPLLLKLNKNNYLNGHTPFSAVLAFLSVFCGVLFDYKHIALSNEKSANEGNVKYLGKIINHQYSKSSEFEKKFNNYCKKYLTENVHYFSFLRKYGELELAKMFSKYPKYFSVFSSCNAGLKLNKKWCLNCPKCLSVYSSLYPYLDKKDLLKIFKQDLFKKKELLETMRNLMGQACPPKLGERRRRSHKPFECVATFKESRLAFNLSLKRAKKSGDIPFLLNKLNAFK
ncbi:MAG: hypothetical protein Q8P63_00150 [Candidatus Nealsonbacteria bacterium]|nr:hypothetical protein [Candidatus Nealsonbacteria bacterium]